MNHQADHLRLLARQLFDDVDLRVGPGRPALLVSDLGEQGAVSPYLPPGTRFLAVQPIPDAEGRPSASLVLTSPRPRSFSASDQAALVALAALAAGTRPASDEPFCELNPEPCCVLDLRGRVVHTSTALLELLGGPLKGETLASRTHPEGHGLLNRALRELAAGPALREIELLHPQQDAAPVRMRWTLKRSALGDRVGAVGRVAEAAVSGNPQLVEQRRHLAHGGLEGVALTEQGVLLDVNEPLARLFGWSAHELVGRSALELIHGDERADAAPQLLAEAGVPFETRGVQRGGEAFPLQICQRRVVMDGEALQVTTFRDLTELKRSEARRVGFVAGITHELRTPLSKLRTALELVHRERGRCPPKVNSLLDVARSSSEGMARLVNDLLDWQRILSGQLVLTTAPMPAEELLRQAVSACLRGARARSVTVALEDELGDTWVNVDRERLTQVLEELINTVVQHSAAGAVVQVQAHCEAGRVRVSVWDPSAGLPELLRERLLRPFSQGDRDGQQGQQGTTGLGLSLARAIVERHGGALGFETGEDRGTRFLLELNAWTSTAVPAQADSAAPSVHLKDELTATHAGGLPRLLYVEDDPDHAELVATILYDIADTEHAATLAEARVLLHDGGFGLLLMDLGMPDGDGLEFLQALQQDEVPLPPAILFSARSMLSEQPELAAAVLIKSSTSNQRLREVVRRLLAGESIQK